MILINKYKTLVNSLVSLADSILAECKNQKNYLIEFTCIKQL